MARGEEGTAAEMLGELESLGDRLGDWLQTNIRLVVIAVAALLLLSGLGAWLVSARENSEKEASTDLAQTRADYLSAMGADPGAMVAVAASADVVAPVVAGCEGVVIANHNSPSQCVLSGPSAAIEMAMLLVNAAGLTARRLQVACAFHSPVVAAAKDGLARRLADMDIAAPRIPVWSNVTAEPYPASADAVRAAMRAGIATACARGAAAGVRKISAGNYGGKLGKYHFHLREAMA